MLQRVLGDEPAGPGRVTELLRRAADAAPWSGHAMYSGLRSLGFPGTPTGDMWRAADLVREHRGDSHVITWAVDGADAVEVLLLTEQFWGVPARAYTPSRGWTDAGRAFREEIEVRTDELERPLLDALGEDLDELLAHLDAWSEAIIDAGSYPQRLSGVYNVGGGPHFGSGLTIDTAAEVFGMKV
jgi:Helix-turn-helix family